MNTRKLSAVLAGMVAVAAIIEGLIICCHEQIVNFILNSPHVFASRMIMLATGCLIVIISVICDVVLRLKHGRCAHDKESDHIALRGFALAMLLMMVFWMTLYVAGLDATDFEGGALVCLATFGSAVAVRNKRWGWIFVYLLIFLFACSIFPAK